MELLKAADREVDEYLRKPIVKHAMVTSLSIEKFPSKRITILGCRITPLQKREPKYPLPNVLSRLQHEKRMSAYKQHAYYHTIRIDTSGRTIHEAASNAFRSLNALRELWSLVATHGKWSKQLGNAERKPIGVIHTGPIFTLHNPDGTVSNENMYWFDQEYDQEQSVFRDNDKWAIMEKFRKRASKLLERHPFQEDVVNVLHKYLAALDHSNTSIAFLLLWSILEKMTDTIGAKYDDTLKRTLWIYAKKQKEVHKEILMSLRQMRNRYVHSGVNPEGQEHVWTIKRFVDPHLLRIINNDFRVNNLKEYAEVLSLPSNTERLKELRRRMKIALEMNKKEEVADSDADQV